MIRNIFQTAEFSPPQPFGQAPTDGESANMGINDYKIETKNVIHC